MVSFFVGGASEMKIELKYSTYNFKIQLEIYFSQQICHCYVIYGMI